MDEDEAYQSPVPTVYEGQRQFQCPGEAYHPLPSCHCGPEMDEDEAYQSPVPMDDGG